MATTRTPPSHTLIARARGSIDIYAWRGIWVLRKFPKQIKQPGTPAQQVAWQAFRDMFAWKRAAPPSWQTLMAEFPLPPPTSTEDVKRKFGLNLAYASALTPVADIIPAIAMTQTGPNETTLVITHAQPGIPANVDYTFRVRFGRENFEPITWFRNSDKETRLGAITGVYKLNFAKFKLPTTYDYNEIQRRWTVTYASRTGLNATIIPVSRRPGGDENPYGPQLFATP